MLGWGPVLWGGGPLFVRVAKARHNDNLEYELQA